MTDGVSRRTTLATLAGGAIPLRQSSSRDLDPTRQAQVMAPFARTRSALDKLRDIGASVRDTGAIGDGRADDTAAIQEMMDYFARIGGEWHFPEGVFRTTKPLIWNCSKPQRVRGRGKRGVYPGRYDPIEPTGLSIILPVHSGRAAIQFIGSQAGQGSIAFCDLALASLETGPIPVAGFAWDATDFFLRDFEFSACSIHGFTSAFDLFGKGRGNAEMGLFKARRCTVNRNRWIARTLNGTQWNGFSFCDNEAGQNGYNPGEGGIAVSAHNALIAGNCFEGQRDAITIFGAMQGIAVRDNYFEANVGRAAIHVQNARGPFDIGANTFLATDPSALQHHILLSSCGPGRVLGSYWPDGVHKTALSLPGPEKKEGIAYTHDPQDSAGWFRLDSFDNGNLYQREPQCLAVSKQRATITGRDIAPWNGRPMPVADHDTSTSAAITTNHVINGSIGDWAVMSWLFRRLSRPAGSSDPYVSMSVNGSGAPGSRDYVANDFDQYWIDGEWCLMSAAIRLNAVMHRLNVALYPYGVKPASSRKTRHLMPIVYVTDNSVKIVPYIDDYIARSVLAPPKNGGFQPGDLLINAAATEGGRGHYVRLPGTDDVWVYA